MKNFTWILPHEISPRSFQMVEPQKYLSSLAVLVSNLCPHGSNLQLKYSVWKQSYLTVSTGFFSKGRQRSTCFGPHTYTDLWLLNIDVQHTIILPLEDYTVCYVGVGSYQKKNTLVLNTARAEDFYACIVQMALFHFGKKKHFKKKRFGGEALQRYFTSIHLSSFDSL